MMSNENSFGWGAYQNKKKEVETLKKQLIVQDTNSFGEVITLNKYNDFQNVKTKENPFRFPNKIKNDEAQKNKCILTDNDEILIYQKKLIEYNKYIYENDSIIKNIQKEYEEKTLKLKKEYENKLLEQKNKYDKVCFIISGLTELINDFKNKNNSITNEDCDKNEIIKNETYNSVNLKENIVLDINETNNSKEKNSTITKFFSTKS